MDGEGDNSVNKAASDHYALDAAAIYFISGRKSLRDGRDRGKGNDSAGALVR